jgi:hypothetical protein
MLASSSSREAGLEATWEVPKKQSSVCNECRPFLRFWGFSGSHFWLDAHREAATKIVSTT